MTRLLLSLTLVSAGLFAQSITESFEGPALSPDWVLTQQAGTVSLSAEQAYAGAQSLKFASTSVGIQRSMVARRQFAAPSKGVFSIYFYDNNPGSETLYSYFQLINSANPATVISMGIDDYDAFCYQADGFDEAAVRFAPNSNCPGGIYPDSNTTSIRRTAGWHRFEADVRDTSVVLKIDGVTVLTYPANVAFDVVQIFLSGPFWRPNGVAYYDNFSLEAPFSVCPLFDQSKAVKSGATVPIKLQVCSGAGANLSSPSLTVRAIGLKQISTNASAEIQDAGNANPDSDFRYDADLGGTGGYIFNLKTTGLQSGTYELSFTIGTSPATYSVQFQVK